LGNKSGSIHAVFGCIEPLKTKYKPLVVYIH